MTLPDPLALPLANAVTHLFVEGGWIMYPMAAAVIVAAGATLERFLWWSGHQLRCRGRDRRTCLARIRGGSLTEAANIAVGSSDPVLRVLHAGLENRHGGFDAAVQAAAADELRPAARGLPLLDTLITMAPLLGLLGTVTGIMQSFVSMGGTELAIDKVTGGIGEALIATAFGLGVAILALIPFNWGHVRVNRLRERIEHAVNQLEVALGRGEAAVQSLPRGQAQAQPQLQPHSA